MDSPRLTDYLQRVLFHIIPLGLLWLCAFLPQLSIAESIIFIPSEIRIVGSESNFTHLQTATLNNQQLDNRAQQLKDRNLTAPQRAMNYQWLSEHSGNEDAIHGSRALSKLLQRGVKSQWNKYRDSGDDAIQILQGSGEYRFLRYLDYDIRVSSSKLLLGLTYEF